MEFGKSIDVAVVFQVITFLGMSGTDDGSPVQYYYRGLQKNRNNIVTGGDDAAKEVE